jgi:hypothetical protein
MQSHVHEGSDHLIDAVMEKAWKEDSLIVMMDFKLWD